MKLAFTSLEIENFKCFVGEPTVLPLGEYEPGLHFIRGRNEAEPRLSPNGAGKSSLWDALCWCLYGKTPDGSRNPDIQPWRGGKHTSVALHARVNKEVHAVLRTANPNMLTLDGVQVGQEQVDHLVGMGFATFTHTVLLGQDRPLFFDLPPREKMELFGDVLDLDRWEARSKVAATRARDFEHAQAVIGGELTGLELNKVDLEGWLEEVGAKSADWQASHGDRQRADSGVLEDVSRRLDQAQTTSADLDTREDWGCTQIIEIKHGILAAEEKLSEAKVVFDEAFARGRAIAVSIAALEASLKDRRCPTCGQAVKGAVDRQEIRAKIKQLQRELEGAVPKFVKRQYTRAEAALKELTDAVTTHQAAADGLHAELGVLTLTIANLTAQKNELERTVATRDEEVNPHYAQLKDLRRRLGKVAAAIKAKRAEATKLGRRTERARFWVRGFKDVRLYVIEEVLQELELATNAALEDVGLVGWEVKYDVEKETKSGSIQRGLNVTIMSPVARRRVRWESWSGGEGQRLRVVGALALSEVLLNHADVQCSLEILDEPAHFMAPAGVRDLCDYLAWRAQGLGKTTWLVDHLAIDSSRFASVLTVTRTEAGATIMKT